MPTPGAKALSDAIAHHEHQTEQLRQAVRAYAQVLRTRGMALNEVLTELRVIFGRNVHLDGPGRADRYHEAKIENLMKLAAEGFSAATPE